MKLQKTTDYRKFGFIKGNRSINTGTSEYHALVNSMSKYGFLPAFPAMVAKNGDGTYYVKDGQHRINAAKELGLPVYYVEDHTDVDISEINKAQRKWTVADHINRWAKEGLQDYIDVLRFYEDKGRKIPLSVCAAILADTSSYGNIHARICSGRYSIKTPQLAERLVDTYRSLVAINKNVRKSACISALWACYHVMYFEPERLIKNAERRPGLLQNRGTVDGFLDMLEEVYNFGRKEKQPLAFDAREAMRKRNPTRNK